MSTIHGVSGELLRNYENLSAGKRINSAADDAAGLSIVKKEDLQINGLNVGKNNMKMAKDVLNVSDGALSGISDYLQRIRELAVQASNSATVSKNDKKALQAEVDELKKGIEDIAKNTTFNTKKLIDGTEDEFELATNAANDSMSVRLPNATLKSLGIADFDLTKDFDISDIDNALTKVNGERSRLGAKSNALEFAIGYNSNAAFYHTTAKSRLEDLDLPQAVSEKKKNEALLMYQIMMQKKKEEEEQHKVNRLIGG